MRRRIALTATLAALCCAGLAVSATAVRAQPAAPVAPPLSMSATEPATATASAPSRVTARYPVHDGQGLSDIAADIAQGTDGATTAQVAAALYRANPRAFIDDDPNRLVAGAVLRLPENLHGSALSTLVAERLAAHAATRDAAASAASDSAAASAPAVTETPQQSVTALPIPPESDDGDVVIDGPTTALSASVRNTEPPAQVAIPAMVLALIALLVVWVVSSRTRRARRRARAAANAANAAAGHAVHDAPGGGNGNDPTIPRDVPSVLSLMRRATGRGDAERFEELAHALWDMTDGEGDAWREAAALGRMLDADHPLYSSDPYAAYASRAAAAAAAASAAGAAVPALAPLDLTLPGSLPASLPDSLPDSSLDSVPGAAPDSLPEPLPASRSSAVAAGAPPATAGAAAAAATAAPATTATATAAPATTATATAAPAARPLRFDFDLDLPDLPALPEADAGLSDLPPGSLRPH